MCGSSCGCGGNCVACKTVRILVSIVLALTTIAAFVGVYRTHFTPSGMVFGTQEASFALLVLVVSLGMWFKTAKKLCPCNYKGCGCGTDGKCAMCGHMPCTCGKDMAGMKEKKM